MNQKLFTVAVFTVGLALCSLLGCDGGAEETPRDVCQEACDMLVVCGEVMDAGQCTDYCVASGVTVTTRCLQDAVNCTAVDYCLNGSDCTCDTTSACEAGCTCDPDCSSTCTCDTTSGCDAGCTCDSDCLCDDTCQYANDGVCDDGGPNSQYTECTYGTDCTDCGPRDPDNACPCDTGTGCQTGCSCDPDCSGSQFHDACICSTMTSQEVGVCSSTCTYPLQCFWSYGEGFCTEQCNSTSDCADYANTDCMSYGDDIPNEWWEVCDY